MILKGDEDLRIKKTINAIHQSFSDMILAVNYEKITVKAICEKAMINKKTFYNYYPALDDLLFEMQEIMLFEFLERTVNYKVPDDLYRINEEFFKYSTSKGKLYERIMCTESYAHIGKNITKKFVKSIWGDFSKLNIESEYKQNILFCFLQNLGLELYRQWVRDGKKIPLDEIIKLTGELLCFGVCGFIEKEKTNKIK